jgi:hypothetical protein
VFDRCEWLMFDVWLIVLMIVVNDLINVKVGFKFKNN